MEFELADLEVLIKDSVEEEHIIVSIPKLNYWQCPIVLLDRNQTALSDLDSQEAIFRLRQNAFKSTKPLPWDSL